jgi:hypothetical protein
VSRLLIATIKKIIIINILFVLTSPSDGWNLPSNHKNHIASGSHNYAIISDVNPDSILIESEGDSVLIPVSDGDSIDISLEESSLKDDLLDILYGAVFRDTSKSRYMSESNLIESEEKFLPYSGQIIANIYISKVPVFGGSVHDTVEFTITRLEEFGNSLHTNTKDRVIKDNLLFNEGDELRPYELADNERILRQLSFIRDARIMVIPREEDERVDILVITRDVFSLGLNVNARAVDDVAISIFDRNLFGNGWEFRNTFRFRSEYDQKVDYEGLFDVVNIRGSFIGMSLKYIYAHDQTQGWIRFYRDYLTPETKYAGGVDFIKTTVRDELKDFKSVAYTSNNYDLWLGRSFLIGGLESRRTIKIGARYLRKTFDERPVVLADSNFSFHTQNLYLANLIFDKREYFTSNMILGFGITEDVPTGYAYEFTAGFSDEEYKDRAYIGLDVRMASWFDNFGYLGFLSQAATFINQEKSEDGLLHFGLQYFSPLMGSGRYKFRHFVSSDYFTGINRFNNSTINIRDEEGIRGLSYDDLDGKERLVVSIESVAFTPWNLIGFQFSMLGFIDLGWINKDKGLLSDHHFSSAIGVGCRIRNEGLVLQTINLRLAYYPNAPEGVDSYSFKLSTSEPTLFSPFSSGKPRIIPFE